MSARISVLSLLQHVQTSLEPIGFPIRRVHGHESDHFTRSSAEVNNKWSWTSATPLCALVTCTGKNLLPLDSISHVFQCAPRKPTMCCYRTTGHGPMRASYRCQAGCYMLTYIHNTYIRTYIHIYVHTYIHSMDPLVCHTDSRMWNTSWINMCTNLQCKNTINLLQKQYYKSFYK
jgi:hypothetical protein